MPHLQLDTAWTYPTEVKRELARRYGEVYVVHTGFSPDWTPDEATTPFVDQLRQANC
ncbi:MAG TPA: hypothetical protein VLL82_02255 [Mycobacterium sp.]|nr:hypothetical protein [Mycobacterium sp.]